MRAFGGLLNKGFQIKAGQVVFGLVCLAVYAVFLVIAGRGVWLAASGLFAKSGNAIVAQAQSAAAVGLWGLVWSALCFAAWGGGCAAIALGVKARLLSVWSVVLAKGLAYLPFAAIGGLCVYHSLALWPAAVACVVVIYGLSVLFTPAQAVAAAEGRLFFGCLIEAARYTVSRGFGTVLAARLMWAAAQIVLFGLIGVLSRFVIDSPSFAFFAHFAVIEPLFRCLIALAAAVALKPLTAPVAANMAAAVYVGKLSRDGFAAALLLDAGLLGIISACGILGLLGVTGGGAAIEAAALVWAAMTAALYGLYRGLAFLLRRRTFGQWLAG